MEKEKDSGYYVNVNCNKDTGEFSADFISFPQEGLEGGQEALKDYYRNKNRRFGMDGANLKNTIVKQIKNGLK